MARSGATVTLPAPDYEAEDVLVVSEPEQLRALGDEIRTRIIALIRERAASTSELAAELGMPKGTVGHHLKVLERAGLIHVVRTRQVRALTEKYYGRTARLFVIKSADDPEAGASIAAATLRQAAAEIAPNWHEDDDAVTCTFRHLRLTRAQAARLVKKLQKLEDELAEREAADGELFGLVVAVYRMGFS